MSELFSDISDKLRKEGNPHFQNNIIFLDIDGVVNSFDNLRSLYRWVRLNYSQEQIVKDQLIPKYTRDEFGQLFDERCIRWLECIVTKTNAKIVISSTWRLNGGLQRMKDLWKYRGLPGTVIDITSRGGETRGEEVKRWLEENDDTDNYVIIDDVDDFENDQNFVQTNGNYGITMETYYKCVEFFK